MNLLFLLPFILTDLAENATKASRLEEIKSLLPNAIFHEDVDSTIHLSHEGREMEFDEKDIDSVQKALEFLKIYDAPKINHSSYQNLLEIEKETEEDLYKNGRLSFIIVFVDKDSFSKLSEIKGIKVFLSTDKKLAEELNTPFPGIFGFNHEDRVIYQLKVKENFEKASFTVRKPLFDIITNQNARLYESAELNTLYLLCKEEEYFNFKKEFFPLVHSLRNEVQFCLMKYTPMINSKSFGILEKDLPAVIAVKETKKYSGKKITKESLKKFINDLSENKLQEYFMSQEENVNNDELPVKRITYLNHEKYVKDVNKDKLIVFEAPWCRFCQILKPSFNKLGEFLSSSDKVLLGTYDMTENEPLKDFVVKGYPTLFLVKGNTNEIKLYESKERDILSLAQFIKNEGYFKVDIIDKVKEYLESLPKEEKEEEKKEEEEFKEMTDAEISEMLNEMSEEEFNESVEEPELEVREEL